MNENSGFDFVMGNAPKVSSKTFIPQRESAKQIPYGVHLSILYFIQFVPGRLPKTPISPAETKMPKCFIVWMDGWVDGLWFFTPFDFPYFQVW